MNISYPGSQSVKNGLSSISLEINNSKCELLLINHTNNKRQTSKSIPIPWPIPIPLYTWPQALAVARIPLHQESAPPHSKAKTNVLDSITETLNLIEQHQVFFILKKCNKNQIGKYVQCDFWVISCHAIQQNWDFHLTLTKIHEISYGERSQTSEPNNVGIFLIEPVFPKLWAFEIDIFEKIGPKNI